MFKNSIPEFFWNSRSTQLFAILLKDFNINWYLKDKLNAGGRF